MEKRLPSVWALFAVSGLFIAAVSAFITSAMVTAGTLAPSEVLTGVPLALYYCLFSAGTVVTGRVALRFGRRPSILAGAVIGAVGGAICALAVFRKSFGLFAFGAALIGLGAGSSTGIRFYAAEMAGPANALRAVAIITGAGLVGGVIGPWLGQPNQESSIRAAFPFIASALLFAVAALPLLLTPNSSPAGQVPADAAREPGGVMRIMAQPQVMRATLLAVCAWVCMVALMTAVPYALHAQGVEGHGIGHSMQLHFLAMYVPVFFVPLLVQKLGVSRVIFLGLSLLAVGGGMSIFASGLIAMVVALIAVGLGWGLLVVLSSRALASLANGPERVLAQSTNDFFVYSAAAIASASAGWSVSQVGVAVIGWAVILTTVVVSIALMVTQRPVRVGS
jgi:MFS family permease